jgi:hypothetical protein
MIRSGRADSRTALNVIEFHNTRAPEHPLGRQKEFERKRREIRLYSHFAAANVLQTEDCSWPIIRAFVPIEDVFKAT